LPRHLTQTINTKPSDMRIFATLVTLLCLSWSTLDAQHALDFWRDVDEAAIQNSLAKSRDMAPAHYRTLALDIEGMKMTLRNAPQEFSAAANNDNFQITLPLPNGEMTNFAIAESSSMMPGLAAKYPNIRSYKGYGVEQPDMSVRLDISINGFHAILHTPEGTVYIDPYIFGQDEFYYAYYWKDCDNVLADNPIALSCGTTTGDAEEETSTFESKPSAVAGRSAAIDLRTYRMAVAATGEFTSRFGGTKESALSAINTAVNRLNEIYEEEVAIRFLLIAQNDTLIFTDSSTDPYPVGNQGGEILGANRNVINSRIDVDDYDIGHAVTGGCTDVGGVAFTGVVCTGGKAFGVSCFSGTVLGTAQRAFAHEVGHQFSASHTMSNCIGSEDQIGGTRVEPGSGSTIMSYAGSCGSQNVQGTQDAYFHSLNLEQMIRYSREEDGNTCPAIIPVGNNEPEIILPYEDGFFIPISTPFVLDAEVVDLDGDDLTYCWEQFNIDPIISDLGDPRGNGPSFRSFPPREESFRVFPRLGAVINNISEDTEVLPTYSRSFTFRCTVRDNAEPAGATVWKEVTFQATENAGPFLVLSPNADSVVWEAGSEQEIIWDVANTDKSPVNAKFVNIKLSLDAGRTYPYTLLESTPNDGAAFVAIPDTLSDDARIRVEATNNIFFDISNQNFDIVPPSAPGFTLSATPNYEQLCLPASAEVFLQADSLLGLDSMVILSVVDGLPDGAVATFVKDTITTTENTLLNIDLANATFDGLIEVTVQGIVPGVDTVLKRLNFGLVYNDFSELALQTPVNTQGNFFGTSTFRWTDLPNADTYDFQLASSPVFGDSIIFEASGITRDSIRPAVFLDDPSSLYFWRVRPNNECGAGEFTQPFVFQTVNAQCSPFVNDSPTSIPSSGTPTVESTLFIPTEGTITDLNIPNIVANYQPIRFLKLTLVSPAGTEAVLFEEQCASTLEFNAGFDDEAPDFIQCPPTEGIVYRPIDSLSIFDGESTQGDWILRGQIIQAGFGTGGDITSWEIEFCADVVATPPAVITNDTFPVPPAARSQITKDFLEVQDEEFGPNDLTYTLISIPENGTLYLNDQPLGVNDRFGQNDINGFRLSYEHDGSATTDDRFTFIVQDANGGLFGTPQFNIVIDEGAVVNTEEVAVSNRLRLFPNPTSDAVQVELEDRVEGEVQVSVFDLQGREIQRTVHAGMNNVMALNTGQLPEGLYLVTVRTEKAIYTERLVVSR